jgi:DNA-binding transcriptional LysR family regulator
LEQLFEYPHVMAQFAGVTMQTSELRATNHMRNRSSIVRTVPNFNVIPALVRGSGCIGILPARMMEAAPGWSGLRMLAVAFEMPSFTEYLIWHSRFAYDPEFCWLRDVMLGAA